MSSRTKKPARPAPEPTPEPREEHEEAFIGSKIGGGIFEEPLRPFSPSRKVAAQAMGCLYPCIGDDGAAQFEKTGFYPGAVKDTVIVLWLCSLEDASEQTLDQVRAGAWNPSKAIQKPQIALGEAMEWAADLEITSVGTERFMMAFAEFERIATAVEKSKFAVSVDGPTGGDDDGPKV